MRLAVKLGEKIFELRRKYLARIALGAKGYEQVYTLQLKSNDPAHRHPLPNAFSIEGAHEYIE